MDQRPSRSKVPEESQEPELLRQGVVNLVLWIPLINLLPLGDGRLLQQLDHPHGSGVCGTDNLPKDLGTEPGHAHSVAGPGGHGCRGEEGQEVRSICMHVLCSALYYGAEQNSSTHNKDAGEVSPPPTSAETPSL